jgi:RNA polymerase sigma-70 factor (ECF subfamily)
LNDPGRAEELTQDVFLALVARRNGYEVRASFRTYLYRIALYRLAAELRRRPLAEAAAGNPAPPPSEPAIVQQVREAVSQLDADHREVVLLREYQQLSYAEIAAVLKIPVGTVRSRLFRAKLALKELLAPTPAGPAPTAPGSA